MDLDLQFQRRCASKTSRRSGLTKLYFKYARGIHNDIMTRILGIFFTNCSKRAKQDPIRGTAGFRLIDFRLVR